MRIVTSLVLCLALPAPALLAQWTPHDPPPPPVKNESTPEKILLGKTLFWDEQLSSTKTVACGTCHSQAGSDSRTLDAVANGALHAGFDGILGTPDDVRGSPGVLPTDATGAHLFSPGTGALQRNVTNRKAPTIINASIYNDLFWDGRANDTFRDPVNNQLLILDGAALENLALAPLLNPVEMAHEGRTFQDVVDRLVSVRPLAMADELGSELEEFLGDLSYPELFTQVFGTSEVAPKEIAFALATYIRSLESADSPADRFVAGDETALTQSQQAGMLLFLNKARCAICHVPPDFASSSFFNTGLRPPEEDPGFGAINASALSQGAFKTPSLRNVALRAPYFHNGQAQTLEEVVDFYVRGGDFPNDFLVKPLDILDVQKTQLVDFLRNGLTDPAVAQGLPPFDRPRLFSETNRVPTLLPPATPGLLTTPHAYLAEPAMLGSDTLTLSVTGGFDGLPAILGLSTVHAPQAMNGMTLHLGLGNGFLGFLKAETMRGQGTGFNALSVTFDLPADPALDGLTLIAQWFLMEPYTATGLSATEGIAIPLFMPRP